MTKRRFILWTVFGCIAAGCSIAISPVAALIFAGAVLFAGMLELGPVFLVTLAVVAASASRVLQMAGVPRLVNFLHFVLVIEAFAAAWMQRGSPSPFARQIARFVTGIFAVCFLSWALNGGEIARPVMLWMVLCEPFLALFALIQARPGADAIRRLWTVLMVIAVVQIPIAVFQFVVVAHGNPDKVQGTFIGQGAGAHVVGAVSLIGVLFCVSKALASRGNDRVWAIAGGVTLFTVPLLADAKQVIVCFLPALIYLVALARRGSLSRLVAPLGVVGALLACAFALDNTLQRITNTSMIENGIGGKLAGLEILAGYMSRSPASWLLGVGPGNSVSRIALMPLIEPVKNIDLRVSPVTVDMINVTKGNYLWSSSSVWTSISSWVGVLGDLGPLGFCVYVWGILLVWRELRRSSGWPSNAAAASLVMAAVLGLFYSWLEEPGFMLMLFTAAGLAIGGVRSAAEARSPVMQRVFPREMAWSWTK